MAKKLCLNCGRRFSSSAKGGFSTVLSCSSCTRRFSDDDMDSFLDSFFSKRLL